MKGFRGGKDGREYKRRRRSGEEGCLAVAEDHQAVARFYACNQREGVRAEGRRPAAAIRVTWRLGWVKVQHCSPLLYCMPHCHCLSSVSEDERYCRMQNFVFEGGVERIWPQLC